MFKKLSDVYLSVYKEFAIEEYGVDTYNIDPYEVEWELVYEEHNLPSAAVQLAFIVTRKMYLLKRALASMVMRCA